jgi:RES domain
VSLNGWCRIVNFKYCLQALSPAGSLRWVGGRFNIGADIDEPRFPSFPALYVAEDFETAFREYHGLSNGANVGGLSPDELSLEDAGSWATLKLTGNIGNVFDLAKLSNLAAVCKIFAKFNLSSRVRELETSAGLTRTVLARKPVDLLKSFMRDDWRAYPVHFDVPANSQVFARMVLEAGFEGILYRSTRGARKCLAIFTRQMGNGDSFVELMRTGRTQLSTLGLMLQIAKISKA